jgi:uncharacterized protein
MKEREIAEKNKILVVRTGSHMYGTNTPESDEDFVGIFMPSEEYVYGFKKVDEVDMSIHSKDENGKNTKEAVDIKYYEFRKFVKLALENNPNILEILFVNPENIIFINDFGRRLLNMKDRFPHQGLKQKFLGYAFSQKHKMFIKKDNYFDLVKAKDFLMSVGGSFSLWEVESKMDKSVFVKKFNRISNSVDFYGVGDINLQPAVTVKTALKMIDERLDKVGNREELYLKHAYDTKFAMHLVRLMIEGSKLLKEGCLEFPLSDLHKAILLNIRQGKHAIEDVLQYANDYEIAIEKIESPLPAKPRYEEIEEFVIKMMKEFLNGYKKANT